MSLSHLQYEALIGGPAETIFELLADMPNYGRWLPGSAAFGATTEVTPYPVRLGTTYLDAGPAGERPGSVTEFDPPKHPRLPPHAAGEEGTAHCQHRRSHPLHHRAPRGRDARHPGARRTGSST